MASFLFFRIQLRNFLVHNSTKFDDVFHSDPCNSTSGRRRLLQIAQYPLRSDLQPPSSRPLLGPPSLQPPTLYRLVPATQPSRRDRGNQLEPCNGFAVPCKSRLARPEKDGICGSSGSLRWLYSDGTQYAGTFPTSASLHLPLQGGHPLFSPIPSTTTTNISRLGW